jgi:cytochrome d ubiquinol oxidase subunit II
MLTLFGDPAIWLPNAFAALMGLSILLYVILDGFDLGVGLLSPLAEPEERDRMIASIGPFWDANETWLVLAVGLLLVAFPIAHGIILSSLYLPVFVMLIGLILRGVAFEFRAKAPAYQKYIWDLAFFAGSTMTALSQGYMLGLYILGFPGGLAAQIFACLTAIGLAVAYSFIGATWLIRKTEGALQQKSISWARGGIWGLAGGLVVASIATPLASERIFDKWFSFPELVLLAPVPLMSALLVALLMTVLRRPFIDEDAWSWLPFAATTVLFALAFVGLAYSFAPYIVPDKITIYDAAASPESLAIILVGALFVLPVIAGYTVLSYFIFRGKATPLSYT